ncbi:MAG: hypothetical protein ACYTGP_11440, partial [Planctomycetota bacterium]
MSEPSPQPATVVRTRRVRRLLRRVIVALIAVAILAVFVAWMMTRSWFIVARVEPALERLLGGEVTIGSADYLGSGRFVFRDVVVRVRQHPGPPGEVCRIGRTDLEMDVDELLAGEILLRTVALRDVNVRMSEDASVPGYFTFMGLKASRVGPRATLPPKITIDDATVEVGVHEGEEFRLRGSRVFSGNMRPTETLDGLPGWYDLTLLETRGERGDVEIDGEWNARTNAHRFRITRVMLDERVHDICPQI